MTVLQPEKVPVQDALEYTGRVEPSQRVEVRSRVSGYLESIRFKDGQLVKAGDPLFVIDQRPFLAARDKARATLGQTTARQALAVIQFERVVRLAATGAASTDDLDRARGEMLSAKASVEASDADLRSAELELSFATVRAPIGGRVSDRRADIGNYLAGASAQGGVLTTIVAQSPAHAMVDLSEEDFQRLHQQKKPPDRVRVSLDGASSSLPANVDFIDNEASPRSGTVRIRATFNNVEQTVIPGNFVRVRIPLGSPQDQLLVPDSAVLVDQTKKIVMVVNDTGQVVAKRVFVGGLSNGKRVVLSGIAAKDKVIISGGQHVRPGDHVQIAKPAKAA